MDTPIGYHPRRPFPGGVSSGNEGNVRNAGVGCRENRKLTTADGHAHVLAINVLAPYLLAALIQRPARLAYLSSGTSMAAVLAESHGSHRE